jgi:hypothetical protein
MGMLAVSLKCATGPLAATLPGLALGVDQRNSRGYTCVRFGRSDATPGRDEAFAYLKPLFS